MSARVWIRLTTLAVMMLALLAVACEPEDRTTDPEGASRYGPWRLIPPGAPIRHVSNLASNEGFNQTGNPEEMAGSPLYLANPIEGFTVESVFAARLGDHPVAVTHEWASTEGLLYISMLEVPDDDLPIDIVRETSGRLALETTETWGHDTLLVVPDEGVSPGVGAVRVWLDGTELVLGSTTFSIDQMQDFAASIVATIGEQPQR